MDVRDLMIPGLWYLEDLIQSEEQKKFRQSKYRAAKIVYISRIIQNNHY